MFETADNIVQLFHFVLSFEGRLLRHSLVLLYKELLIGKRLQLLKPRLMLKALIILLRNIKTRLFWHQLWSKAQRKVLALFDNRVHDILGFGAVLGIFPIDFLLHASKSVHLFVV